MERLTSRAEDGLVSYRACFEPPCNGMGCEREVCEYMYLHCDVLAAYEDTGLTPEECAALKKENEEIRQNSVSHEVFIDLLAKYQELKEAIENGAPKH